MRFRKRRFPWVSLTGIMIFTAKKPRDRDIGPKMISGSETVKTYGQ